MKSEVKPKHRNKTMTTPFRETSMLGRSWSLAIKGTSLKELTRLCTKEGANIAFLLRTLRKKSRFGWTWQILEENGKFKIYNAKRP